jgi:hypothetical protein
LPALYFPLAMSRFMLELYSRRTFRLSAFGRSVAERLGPGKTVATIIVDSGLRYVSTDVFRNG